MKIVDCRGMACPLPVVTVKRALEAGGGEQIRVLLDDGPPRENVARFAANRGYEVLEQRDGADVALLIGGSADNATSLERPAAKTGDSVVFIASDRLGDGPEELGRLLMKNFIITLLDLPTLPDRVLFVNSGVLLACSGSEALEALVLLGNRGVEVMSCGVCLDFFHRRDELAAGVVTNMYTIAESLVTAGAVVRI